jgi:3-keto-disaccharide hydrolase
MRCLVLITLSSLMSLAAAAGKAEDNTPPPGFTALFNGKDLTGWQGAISIKDKAKLDGAKLAAAQQAANDKVFPHWKVEHGVLVNDGQGGNLATAKDYGNFELLIDWKIEPTGDSGIYLRGLPQVQIWDSDSLDMNRYKLEFGKGSGALWNNSKPEDKVPLKRADKAPGEWNTFHIAMKGDRVIVKLNGQLVVDNVALDNIYEKGMPLPAAGPIELQQHPKQDGKFGNIMFKNVFLKELP